MAELTSAEPSRAQAGQERSASGERLHGFIAGKYLCGKRGQDLFSGTPAAWRQSPHWPGAMRLAAALSNSDRALRAAALAPELEALLDAIAGREIR